MDSVNEADFAREVLGAVQPVLVDFTADWCPPCEQIAPVLESLTDLVRVVKVDVDENPVVADLYQVTKMPTLVLFAGGREVTRIDGVKPREVIVSEIEPHLSM